MKCWCGNQALLPFSDDYLRCAECETLVVRQLPSPSLQRVQDEEHDLYGRNYWFEHQEGDLGSISIVERARSDLAERCVFWLSALVPYVPPPAAALELGSGHGGFVAMMRWLGYDAQGLELSPWIVDFARRTFGVPMLLGRIEDQDIPARSLDLIVLMDVLEHLPDPVGTIGQAASRLRPGGTFFLQTPCYPEGAQYGELVARGDLFLKMLVPGEHIYLFSQSALRRLLGRAGMPHVVFEPAMAPHDMMVLASDAPLARASDAAVEAIFDRTPAARLIGALVSNERRVAAERASLRAWANAKEQAAAQTLGSTEAALAAKDAFIDSLQAALAERSGQLADASAYGVSLEGELADARQQHTEYAESLRDALAAKDEQVRSLAATLADRESELAEAKAYIESLRSALARGEAEAASVKRHIDALELILTARETELANAKTYLSSLEQHIEQTRR